MFQICKKIPTFIKYWFILAITVTGLVLISFALVQQDIRQSAYDPQIQIAEDSAIALAGDKDPKAVIRDEQIDISKSLAPFTIVFNDKGQPIQSTGDLAGKIPTPPLGVFDYTRKNGTDKFTWEPRLGIRIAAVVVYRRENREVFVLTGRSLREIEKRVERLLNITFVGLGVILFSTLVTAVLFRKSN